MIRSFLSGCNISLNFNPKIKKFEFLLLLELYSFELQGLFHLSLIFNCLKAVATGCQSTNASHGEWQSVLRRELYLKG